MLITTTEARLDVTTSGEGPPVVMLHGWPHTSFVWHEVASRIHGDVTVLAPNARGIGASRPFDGHDATTRVRDLVGLLDALEIRRASLVAIDAGVTPAVLAALLHPDRIDRLIVMEGLVAGVPGEGALLDGPPPWWFGFHAAPDLAEHVVVGRERTYLEYFLRGPSARHDIGQDAVDAFVEAYDGVEALRAGFGSYRAAAQDAETVRSVAATRRLTVPTLAVAGGVVGDALRSQLSGLGDSISHVEIPDCGHIIPLEKPQALSRIILDFLVTSTDG